MLRGGRRGREDSRSVRVVRTVAVRMGGGSSGNCFGGGGTGCSGLDVGGRAGVERGRGGSRGRLISGEAGERSAVKLVSCGTVGAMVHVFARVSIGSRNLGVRTLKKELDAAIAFVDVEVSEVEAD